MSLDGIDWPRLLRGLQLATWEARRADAADARRRRERALRLLDSAFDQTLDLETVARSACYSPYHFHRWFRREVGETPLQYLTRRRIERARELLRSTDASVLEVCLAVGFSSPGSFSTLFRRFTGHAPSHYRARVVACAGVPKDPTLASIPACFLQRIAGIDAAESVPGSR